MKPKAYPDETITEIREKHRNGAKINDLAKEYYVCRNTVKSYCKGVRKLRKGA
jgi:transcriptional antiterminator